MKRLLALMTSILAILMFFGCSSNEKKANKLIDDYMYKHLHDYKSYEPVETIIDTLYNVPITDDTCFQAAVQMAIHSAQIDEYIDEAEDAERSMEIWKGGWSSTARNEWKKAARKSMEARINECVEYQEILRCAKIIVEKLPELDGKTQVGWMVKHSYRCNNRGGNSMLGTDIFFIDKKFKTILNSFDNEDEDAVAILTQINEASEYGNPSQIDTLIAKYEGMLPKLKSALESIK